MVCHGPKPPSVEGICGLRPALEGVPCLRMQESPELDLGTAIIGEMKGGYRSQKDLGDAALTQLDEAEWHATLDEWSNPISVIVRHVAGNLRSRFTDFLTTDGEKPDRNHDGEFEFTPLPVPTLLAEWQEGFRILWGTLDALTPADLERTVHIRGEPHTVLKALTRNFAHTSHHVGQIVLLAKHLRGERWQTLSIPRRKP